MKLLVIGSDRNLFKKDSDVWNRYLDYGKLFEEIHVIVFSAKKLDNKDIKIGDNVFVYPTDHICKLFYLWNVYKISKNIIQSLGISNSSLVISSQDPFESGLAAWMLKKIYKVPFQIQIHTDFLSSYFWKESFINKLRVILAKFLIPRADGIRVVSERIRKTLVSSAKLLAPISALPIYIDVEKIRSASVKIDLHKKYPQFDHIILMASRLTKEKNIGLAIKAMPELVKKYPKLGLVIVGSGPEFKNLQLTTYNLQLNENIKFEGWSDDLVSYYKTADLFLLTSDYEGYGRSIIEALAAGLPIVMTDVGLAGETIINDKNGIVIPVRDKQALIGAVDLLISDSKKKKEFILEGERTIKSLMTKEKYLEFYKNIKNG